MGGKGYCNLQELQHTWLGTDSTVHGVTPRPAVGLQLQIRQSTIMHTANPLLPMGYLDVAGFERLNTHAAPASILLN